MTTLTQADASARHIKRADMVACKLAFIDCKMPGSQDKENYSLIGAGVTQSADQVVNITEPHGFSIGAAAMPPGTINNLHVHYTAEVFMVFSGEWTFRWGSDGQDGTITGRAGDVVSMPTWIFRGFSNTGNQDGFIFTALGGDDTGGIIWHPSILEQAGQYGLYLTAGNMLGRHRRGCGQAGAGGAAAPHRPHHGRELPPLHAGADAPPRGAGRRPAVVRRCPAGQRPAGPCERARPGAGLRHDRGPQP